MHFLVLALVHTRGKRENVKICQYSYVSSLLAMGLCGFIPSASAMLLARQIPSGTGPVV